MLNLHERNPVEVLKLAFATAELREFCENQIAGEHEFGTEVARQLRERLASMREAENVTELVTGKPELVPGCPKYYQLLLPDSYRIVFCANHPKQAELQDASTLDWSKVNRVLIQSVAKSEVPCG